jgi:hypothetical protein
MYAVLHSFLLFGCKQLFCLNISRLCKHVPQFTSMFESCFCTIYLQGSSDPAPSRERKIISSGRQVFFLSSCEMYFYAFWAFTWSWFVALFTEQAFTGSIVERDDNLLPIQPPVGSSSAKVSWFFSLLQIFCCCNRTTCSESSLPQEKFTLICPHTSFIYVWQPGTSASSRPMSRFKMQKGERWFFKMDSWLLTPASGTIW